MSKPGWFGATIPDDLRVYRLPEEWFEMPPNCPYVNAYDENGEMIGVRLLTETEMDAYFEKMVPSGTRISFKVRYMTEEERMGADFVRDEDL